MSAVQNMGDEYVSYFVGVVVDTDDPLKMGRVKVRIHGVHEDPETSTKTFPLVWEVEDLKWSTVLMPPIAPMLQQVGITPVGLAIGSSVVGLYLDGSSEKQMPVIIGVIATIPGMNFANHGVPIRGRGSNDLEKTKVGPEPADPYAGEYPSVQSIKTTSGHIIEVDDTVGAERIHLYHKSGSYIELQPNGAVVIKAAGDVYNIATKKQTMYAQGDISINTKGKTTINSTGDTSVTGKQVNVTSKQSVTINGASSVDITSGGPTNLTGSSVNIG